MKKNTSRFIHKLFCFCACALMILAANAAITRGQATTDGYDPNADGTVSAIAVQRDGKSLVGGRFTYIGGAQSKLARLNADGKLDASFAPTIDSDVAVIVVQADDKILLAGSFTTVNGQARPRLARLNADGTLDAAFNPTLDEGVSAVAVQPDGKILISGFFTNVNGQPRSRVARLNADGSLDAAFSNPNADNTASRLVLQPDGKIVIGGSFLNVGGVPRNRIARLNRDGSLDAAFNPNADNLVQYLALQADGKILAGGIFANIGGVAKPFLARLNRDGTVDNSFQGITYGRITAITVAPDGKILIGGTDIETPGVNALRKIVRLNRADGSLDANFAADTDEFVYAIAVQPDNKVLIGGRFTNYRAVRPDGSLLYTQPRSRIARLELDGNLDLTFRSFPTLSARAALVQPDGKIVAAGGAGTTSNPYYVKRGTAVGEETSFTANPNGEPNALALQPDGKILVGGSFTQINNQPRSALARLNADGSVDAAFATNFVNAGSTAIIYAVVAQADGKILAGGTFTSINGSTRSGIVRLSSNGTLDTAFTANTDGAVRSIVVQTDGKIIIGGDFTTVNGVTRTRLARLDAATGAADAFNPAIDARVNAVTVQADGKIIAGGEFSNAGGAARTRIARFNADGTLDPNFNLLVQPFTARPAFIAALALQADNKIIIAGSFFRLNENYSTDYINLARLNADGTLDAALPNPNADVKLPIRAVTLQADGKILIGTDSQLISRVSNPTAAVQTLDATRANILWTRGLASARLSRATFEVSSDDGANYTLLGSGTRVGATESFNLNNPNLPINQNILIRARGVYLEASNGGTESIVESVRSFYFAVPTAANDGYTTNEDTTLNVVAPGVLANDMSVGGLNLTAILVSPPAHGTLTLSGNGSFVYVPAANYNGADSFTYKANNGENDSNVATVNLTINSVNDVPVAVNDQYATRNSLPLNVAAPGVLANDTDPDNSLTAVLVGGTINGTLNLNSNGSFTYTPNANFVGTEIFTYRANDGAANSNVATVTITVTNPISRTVTKTADTNDGVCDGDCSLREAIATAEAGDSVNFSTIFDQPQTITLSPTLQNLTVSKSLTILGKGANLLTVQRQAGAGRYNLFFIPQGNIKATISGMTLTGGLGGGSGGAISNNANLTVNNCLVTGNAAAGTGGGIYNSSTGTLTINNSAVTNNSAPSNQFDGAGGIFNQGALTLINSTVSGNVVTGDSPRGGGIFTRDGSATIVNSTITDNAADGANSAGGLFAANGTVTIRSSIVAANRNNTTVADVSGSFASSGYNLIGNVGAAAGFNKTGDQTGNASAPLDPRLDALGNYGGTTPTHRLQSNSPAIDKGSSFGLTIDQRGSQRPVDIAGIANAADGADIGAFELSPALETGYEGDMAGRPSGDGLFKSDDLIQLRRFLNGADTPDSITANEFQRADSAPYAPRGDGALCSNDLIQLRRYLNGADAAQAAGGPTAQTGACGSAAAQLQASKPDAGESSQVGEASNAAQSPQVARELRVESPPSTSAGQMVTVNIRVDALGDESAYSFRLNYNQAVLTNPVFNDGTTGAAIVDCDASVTNRIGCTVEAFPRNNPSSGSTSIREIDAGNNQLLLSITFTVAAGASAQTVPLTLSNVSTSNDRAQNLTITPTSGSATITGPTAADVSIGGRILTSGGKGLTNARVVLTDAGGNTRTVMSSSFGYYRFDDVAAGETVVIAVASKRYAFAPQVVSIFDDLTELNFTAIR